MHSDAGLIASMVVIVVAGGVTLFLAQPAHKAEHPHLLRAGGVLFLLAVAATFAQAGADVVPATTAVPGGGTAHASLAQVLTLVKEADTITGLPRHLDVPPAVAVTKPPSNWGATTAGNCGAALNASTVPTCAFGDLHSPRTVVLFGDSHAQMWFHAVDDIATRDHWRLVLLSKGACPAADVVGHLLNAVPGERQACEAWHRYVYARINRIHPAVLIVTEEAYEKPDGSQYSPAQWKHALASTLERLHAGRTIVLGNIPPTPGPGCLLKKTVRECSSKPNAPVTRFIPAERAAAQLAGATYVDVMPWFCARRCSPVIGTYDVYFDASHVGLHYTEHLEGVLATALGI